VKKDSIEQAAIGLFATCGLAGTTIKDIASRAGVTEGALYRHYKGKNEMAWALYCREVRRFTEAFAPVLATDDAPLEERMLQAVKFIYQYYNDQPDHLVFALLTRQSFPQQSLLDDQINPDHLVTLFIKREIARGNARKGNPDLMMAMLRGIVLEPILMHRYGRLQQSPIRLAHQVAAACARVLKE